MQTFIQLDHGLFAQIHNLRDWGLDYVLGWPTHLGSIYIILPAAFLGLFFFDRKNLVRHFVIILFSAVFLELIIHGIKYMVARPRPFDVLEDVRVLFNLPHSYSFPSGHTAMAFFTAVLLQGIYGRRFFLLVAIAVLVAFSRVYIGVHFPSDVFAGSLLGMAGAMTALWMLKRTNLLQKVPGTF